MADAFIGEIRAFGFPWAPEGWLMCDGTLASIAQYPALNAIVGTTFGGDGQKTFGLPNLRGRTPMDSGQGVGLTNRPYGGKFGAETATVGVNQMPPHIHAMQGGKTTPVNTIAIPDATSYVTRGYNVGTSNVPIDAYASGSVAPNTTMSPSTLGLSGTGQAHENRQPLLVLNFFICWNGWFPARP